MANAQGIIGLWSYLESACSSENECTPCVNEEIHYNPVVEWYNGEYLEVASSDSTF